MHDRVATKHQKIIILTPIVTYSFFLPRKHKKNFSYKISVRSLSRCSGWCIPHTPTTSYLAKHQMPPDGRKTERLAAKRHRPEEKKQRRSLAEWNRTGVFKRVVFKSLICLEWEMHPPHYLKLHPEIFFIHFFGKCQNSQENLIVEIIVMYVTYL